MNFSFLFFVNVLTHEREIENRHIIKPNTFQGFVISPREVFRVHQISGRIISLKFRDPSYLVASQKVPYRADTYSRSTSHDQPCAFLPTPLPFQRLKTKAFLKHKNVYEEEEGTTVA
ncbi:hypothetical protein EUGRSUZ_B03542 [Eucalyptus grandis]|uniref:Uncharacterized protein n=2 Tax=Eucalyptus grandis TaxID=71139 RepID=A0ACC3LXI7_EUCGR|nr:hypothetical protein EUGRSUZ_B03542 [Eucalyptus grandis]